MFKSTLILAQINPTFTVKFSVIIENDNQDKFVTSIPVNKFKYGDNDFLKITPKPYIEFDISNKRKKDEVYSTNNLFKFTPKELLIYVRLLGAFIKSFKDNKDLYYYDNEKNLYINQTIASKLVLTMYASGKSLQMVPVLVPGEKEYEQYEGAMLYINNMSHQTMIRYDDLEFLYLTLKNIDMYNLSLHMIEIAKLYKNDEEKVIEVKPILQAPPEENEMDNKPFVRIEEPDTIPDI